MFAPQQCTAAYASAMVAALLILFVCVITDASSCMLLMLRVVPQVQAKRELHGHGLLLLRMHQHGGSFLGVHVSSATGGAGGWKIAQGANN
jgi:hypothetical protein